MKSYFLFTLTCFIYCATFAQIDTSGNVDFTSSKINNKLILIELQSASVKNKTAKFKTFSALTNAQTSKYLSENFNCFRSYLGDNMSRFLARKQILKILPAYYILDVDSNFLIGSYGARKTISDFKLMKDSALINNQRFNDLKFFKDKLAQNTLTKSEFRAFIELKLQLQLYDNGHLIEKFAAQMDEADLNDPELLLLIMQAGPFYSGLAAKKAVTNKELYSSVYKKEYSKYSPRFDRRALNNSIAYATETKNIKLIQEVARSYQYRYYKSKYDKETYNPYVMMNFYRNLKDTSNLLIYLCKNYDQYLLITPDSAKKYKEKVAEARKKDIQKLGVKSNYSFVSSSASDFSSVLNNAASEIISLKTKDPFYLNKGMEYCQHALLLTPIYYKSKATLAKLLYLSGFYTEAEKTLKELINTKTISETLRSTYKTDLLKMQNNLWNNQ